MIDIKDKILNTNFSEKAIRRMKLFVGFAIPAMSSILYYGVTNFVGKSDIISIIWSIFTAAIWYIYAKKMSKSGISFKKAYFSTHSLMLFGCIFSILSILLWPNIPEFIKLLSSVHALYLFGLEAITAAPTAHIASIFISAESYYRWMAFAPVVGTILLTAIFSLGFEGDE